MLKNSISWPKVFLGITAYSGKIGQRSPYLARFLETIQDKTTYPHFDIVIYDDCSPNNFTEDVVSTSSLDIQLIKGKKPLVRPHLTRGALMSEFMKYDYPYALFFDDDFIIIQDNWLKHMIYCMESITNIGILGGFWCTLEDGITRQLQHTPISTIIDSVNNCEVSINKFVCGGCWCVRRNVIEILGIPPTNIDYDGESPGWDTYYHNLMLDKTDYQLCCTRTDMSKHVGQEFMIGNLKHKYTDPNYRAGKRLY